MLQSPPDVALIFRTYQLHTAWELLYENGSRERQAAWRGQLHWRADNTQKTIKQKKLSTQKYCIPANISKLFHPKCWKWPRAFPCMVMKLLSNRPKSSSSTVSSALHKESFPAPTASLAASASAPYQAAPVLEPGCRCYLLQGSLWYGGQVHAVIHKELVTVRNLPRGAGLQQSATKLAIALLDTPQQSHRSEEREDLKMV